MSDESNVVEGTTAPEATSTATETGPAYATVEEVRDLADRVSKLEGDEGVTPQNDQLTPDQPGIEPEPPADPPIVPAPAPEAPLSAGAPEATIPGQAPEPEHATPPADTPTPVADPGGLTTPAGSEAAAEGSASGEGVPAPSTTPDPAATPEPAADASEKPLYLVVSDDPSYTIPAGYVPTDLVTPDGKVLYHHTDDVAGEPGTGAVDGEVGIYADDDVVPTA